MVVAIPRTMVCFHGRFESLSGCGRRRPEWELASQELPSTRNARSKPRLASGRPCCHFRRASISRWRFRRAGPSCCMFTKARAFITQYGERTRTAIRPPRAGNCSGSNWTPSLFQFSNNMTYSSLGSSQGSAWRIFNPPRERIR